MRTLREDGPADRQPGHITAAHLLRALSVTKSQLADLLGVTRPTLAEWLAGSSPDPAGSLRLDIIARVLDRAGVTGTPLNAALVRHPLPGEEASLLDVLCAAAIDEDYAVRLAKVALREDATRRASRARKEAYLCDRGFAPVDPDAARQHLAFNIASGAWPRV